MTRDFRIGLQNKIITLINITLYNVKSTICCGYARERYFRLIIANLMRGILGFRGPASSKPKAFKVGY